MAAEKNPAKNVILFRRWLEQRARHLEKQRDHRGTVEVLNKLLKALTRTTYAQRVRVETLASIHYRLGLAHRALNDSTKSLAHLKTSIQLNSSEPRYYEAFGKAYLSGGHWRVAKTQYERALSLDPKNAACIRQYAWVLMMMGKKDEARMYSLRALRLNPSSREGQWHLIRIYMESELFLQALLLLKCLKRKKGEEQKIAQLIEECKSKLEATFEGSVLRIMREGLRSISDDVEFSIPLWREAERLWIDFCISKTGYRRQGWDTKPHIWAAAVAYLAILNDPKQDMPSDDLFARFQATSVEVWPCIRHLQEYMLKKTA